MRMYKITLIGISRRGIIEKTIEGVNEIISNGDVGDKFEVEIKYASLSEFKGF